MSVAVGPACWRWLASQPSHLVCSTVNERHRLRKSVKSGSGVHLAFTPGWHTQRRTYTCTHIRKGKYSACSHKWAHAHIYSSLHKIRKRVKLVNFRKKYDASASGIGRKGKTREDTRRIAGKAGDQRPFVHFQDLTSAFLFRKSS